jgi:hypothetical protein
VLAVRVAELEALGRAGGVTRVGVPYAGSGSREIHRDQDGADRPPVEAKEGVRWPLIASTS